jgi:hypothetical protein
VLQGRLSRRRNCYGVRCRSLILGSMCGLRVSSVPFCGARKEKKKLHACRGEGSAAGLQLRVRFVPAGAAGYAKDCTGSPVCF